MPEQHAREQNIAIWDRRYRQGESLLRYPEDIFVRIAGQYLDRDQHRTILDYGFGAGANMLHLLRKGFEVTGVEVSLSAIEYVDELTEQAGFSVPLELIAPDGRIPFEDATFDGVVAWGVLLYNDLDGFSIAVDEINRVLRPGGTFLGTLRAPGDRFQATATSLGEGLFRMTVKGQEGAMIIVPEQDELPRLFKRDDLVIGFYEATFVDILTKNWLVMYKKED